MFSKILIANRGEIAVRIIRACKEMGVSTVAVYSRRRTKTPFMWRWRIKATASARPTPADSYLNEESDDQSAALLCREHRPFTPGYGFLSENAHFARLCRRNGVGVYRPECRRAWSGWATRPS